MTTTAAHLEIPTDVLDSTRMTVDEVMSATQAAGYDLAHLRTMFENAVGAAE